MQQENIPVCLLQLQPVPKLSFLGQIKLSPTIESMEKLLTQKPCEIFVLDESHFSTEPYLVRGWFKKRWPPQDPEFQQKRKLHHVWMLKFKEASFLLETIQAS